MAKTKKKIWCINQCDYCSHCEYMSNGKYYCNTEEYKLNPENEVNIKCKCFETKSYNDSDIYDAMLRGYCEKMDFPYYGREIFFSTLITEEQKKQKCIELDLIKNNDFKLMYLGETVDSNYELIDDEYNKINRSTEEYLEWQFEVFKRDNHKCIICGSNKNLNAHHLDSFTRYPDSRYAPNNGVTLCEKHHLGKHINSFHNIYGTRTFTKDDFFIYKNNQTNTRQIS